MKLKLISALAAAVGLMSAAPAFAMPVTLDFEGATSFASLNDFYNGGTDSGGASGTNYGISFSGDALALVNDGFGSGVNGAYFSNAPSAGTILAPVGPNAALNSVLGFTSASFFYSSADLATVNVFTGLNGTGTLLGAYSLFANAQNGCSDTAFCHWDLTSLSFAGVAHSIQFGGATLAGIDNVTVAPVPLPAAGWLFLSALGGLGLFSRRTRG